eukprot:COSAG01_NODE_8658_length_2705_cov_19.586723_3_plen_66_part_00
MYACAHNQSAVVRRLLRAGADPTVTTGIAMSAYEYAAIGNAEGCVRYLVARLCAASLGSHACPLP